MYVLLHYVHPIKHVIYMHAIGCMYVMYVSYISREIADDLPKIRYTFSFSSLRPINKSHIPLFFSTLSFSLAHTSRKQIVQRERERDSEEYLKKIRPLNSVFRSPILVPHLLLNANLHCRSSPFCMLFYFELPVFCVLS